MNRLIFLIFLTFCSNDFSFAARNNNLRDELPKIETINCNLLNWKDLQCAIIMKPSNFIYDIRMYNTDLLKNESSLLDSFSTGKSKTFYHLVKHDFVTEHNYLDEIYMYGLYNDKKSEIFKIPLTNIIFIKEKIQVGNRYRYIQSRMEISPWK